MAVAAGELGTVRPDLVERARAWIEGDPDPATREELEELIRRGDTDALASRMDGTLGFGTAGIRGEVGAGPNRMNRAMVIRVTRGLADHLIARHGDPPSAPVVLGFDARPTSRRFAEDTAGVLGAAGIAVRYFPDVVPTPLVAFAAKELDAVSAIVVTASHNPPSDNGYKVYAPNAAQIVPPLDHQIAEAIELVGPAAEVPRLESPLEGPADLVWPVPDDLFERYFAQVDRTRPSPTPSGLRIVYTPLHGVGGATLARLFARAGHSGLIPVPEQAEPDGSFPTVAFPNPEEEGALDLAVALAVAEDADLVLANDPDADRLAAVVPDEGVWRNLTGNELGVLLGDYVLRHHRGGARPIVINSIVSSPMLAVIVRKRDAHFERTLTGFKWIANAAMSLEESGVGEFVFGYEEALGYTVGSTVRDKDGISAALVLTDLVAGLAAEGRTVLDRLEELWSVAGLWVSAQHSIVRKGAEGHEAISGAVAALAADPPKSLGGWDVVDVGDYRTGAESRPPWLGAQDLVELALGDQGRVLVRPSGTEPKLKIYVDLSAEPGPDPRRTRERLEEVAGQLAAEVTGRLPL